MAGQTDRLLIVGEGILVPDGCWPINWLLIAGGKIAQVGKGAPPSLDAQTIHAGDWHVLPGFIDVHTHGAVGYDTMFGTEVALRKMAGFYAQHGVTGFLPTTWTEQRAKIDAALAAIKPLVGQPLDGATILGAHLEGPYISEQRIGAQDPRYVRRAERDEAESWLRSGIIKMIALAPEFPENYWLIEHAARRGIVVAIAHTTALAADVERAKTLGARQATHTFNAMTGLHHREPGTVGAVLADDDIYCELIADNIHVHPTVMKLMYRAKGPSKILLITDAVTATGLPEGKHAIAEDRHVLVQDGAVRLPDGTLAGSALTMDAALRNYMAATGLTLEQAWPATSLNAARQFRWDDRKGQILEGYDADLVLLDSSLHVQMTIAQGRIVYQRETVRG